MIIDLNAIKGELRVDIDDDDQRIMSTVDQAVAIVLKHMKVDSDFYENVSGVSDFPDSVYAAIVRVTMSLYDDPQNDPLTPAVISILNPLRDPAMA